MKILKSLTSKTLAKTVQISIRFASDIHQTFIRHASDNAPVFPFMIGKAMNDSKFGNKKIPGDARKR